MSSTWQFAVCAGLAVGGVVGTGYRVEAQQDWTPGKRFSESATRVMGGIKRVTDKNNYGYCEGICILAAFMTNGGETTFLRHFTRGEEYAIIGGGDDGVVDLDITILDKSGKAVASDTDADATPVVEFRAPATGQLTIKVQMAKAAKNGGFATVGLLVKGGYRVPVDNLAAALTNVIVQCEDVNKKTTKNVLFSSGNNQWAVFGSMVGQGKEITVENLTPGAGTRVWVSGGDTTTQDIDLFLLDSKGKVVGEDTDDDAVPRVVANTGRGEQYGFRVKNVKSKGTSLVLTAVLTVSD